MSTLKYFSCIVLLVPLSKIHSQDNNILIFDPAEVSTNFQYTLSQLTEDSIFVADSLDDSIFDYDAAFLFIDYPYVISNVNSYRLIEFTAIGKPIYVFSQNLLDSTSIAFWNHLGLNDVGWLLISVLVDSVSGIDTIFTSGVVMDTSFMSWEGIPGLFGEIAPILIGWSSGIDVLPTYISTVDTLRVILDLYNLIDNADFLKRVLEYFELQPPNYVDEEIISLTEFALSQNYPNPFNPSTKIKYQIPFSPPLLKGESEAGGFVTLKVYDILGNELATLVNEEKQPGTYEIEFNVAQVSRPEIASGIYFYKLKAGNYIETKKMVLIK